jgi:sialate O-acetylesterase
MIPTLRFVRGFCFMALAIASATGADLLLPAIFSDQMVLQRHRDNRVWGWDTPGTRVTVRFAGQVATGFAANDGRWTVTLRAVPASAMPYTLEITGTATRIVRDVLVGEVWMCSGQSNMNLTLANTWNADLESAAANLPQIRLIRLPLVGTQIPQRDIVAKWAPCTSLSAREFSAIGFHFGRILHDILNVPIGLIHNAWGGSEAEAWVRRESLESDPRFGRLTDEAARFEAEIETGRARAEYGAAMEKFKLAAARAVAEGRPLPAQPYEPTRWLTGNARPGNIFNGMIIPLLGYGMRGVIWYQGESNARRAHEYIDLFPFLIEEWRREWNQDDLRFYWVQLADYWPEQPVPGDSTWAELREAQTKAMRLPYTGQAVITDLGEAQDIHPKNKREVALRLARWALAKDYGLEIPYRSPEFRKMEILGGVANVMLDCFGSRLRTFDVPDVLGFTICGEDRVWHRAQARIVGDHNLEVWSDRVPAPVAIRYAWADNPTCNLITSDGLPVTPFRTDDFEMTTKLQ